MFCGIYMHTTEICCLSTYNFNVKHKLQKLLSNFSFIYGPCFSWASHRSARLVFAYFWNIQKYPKIVKKKNISLQWLMIEINISCFVCQSVCQLKSIKFSKTLEFGFWVTGMDGILFCMNSYSFLLYQHRYSISSPT